MSENAEARKARAFLQKRGLRTADMPPRQFAAAAKETGKSFAETLKLIATLKMGTQGHGPAPIAAEIAKEKAA